MVLGAVIEAEGINAIGIAEARGLTVDEVTATLDELVRRGLIAEV
jgi:DNA-binding MarR family transcriptional regulator